MVWFDFVVIVIFVIVIGMSIRGFLELLKSESSSSCLSSLRDDSSEYERVREAAMREIQRRNNYESQLNISNFSDVVSLEKLRSLQFLIDGLSPNKKMILILLIKELIFYYKVNSYFPFYYFSSSVPDNKLITVIASVSESRETFEKSLENISSKLKSISLLEVENDFYISLALTAFDIFLLTLIFPFIIHYNRYEYDLNIRAIYKKLGVNTDNFKSFWKNDSLDKVANEMDDSVIFTPLCSSLYSFNYYASLEMEEVNA